MNMLARKISRAKWERSNQLAENEIRADAVTRCLTTSDDTLSWWRCNDDEESVAQVALAVASAPGKSTFDKIDLVVLPKAIFDDAGVASESTDGETPVKDLRSRHVDLIRLDLERLAKVARILGSRIRSRDRVVRFTKAELVTLVNTAIRDERLDPDDLSEGLREQLAKSTSGLGS